MPLQLTVVKKVFRFRFNARTSRGDMPERVCWFLTIRAENGFTGIGEAAPIFGLSRETQEDVERDLILLANKLADINGDELKALANQSFAEQLSPSVRMALEMAAFDLSNGGIRKYFDSPFWKGEPMAINGLVWMDSLAAMKQQAFEKLEAGFSCIKIKVGAHDHEGECDLLAEIRKHPLGKDATLRLDANGAYVEADALARLRDLAAFRIHSVEQPVRSGNPDLMGRICRESPIPVALDEELIASRDKKGKKDLLLTLRPAFVVLKPSLLGGFKETRQWLESAVEEGIGWWITSALESPLGLHAIAQFTSGFNPALPQGLGTGAIFQQESVNPLIVEKGRIRYEKAISWDI